MCEAHILGPGGSAAQIEMTPDPNTPGTFHADWNADQAWLLPHRSDRDIAARKSWAATC